jgi:hypothetical protein
MRKFAIAAVVATALVMATSASAKPTVTSADCTLTANAPALASVTYGGQTTPLGFETTTLLKCRKAVRILVWKTTFHGAHPTPGSGDHSRPFTAQAGLRYRMLAREQICPGGQNGIETNVAFMRVKGHKMVKAVSAPALDNCPA